MQVLTPAGGAAAGDAAGWRQAFDAPAPLTVGVEEEVMVLDARTLDLAPRAAELVTADGRLRRELPAAQLELCGDPAATVGDAAAQLLALRRRALDAARARGLTLAAAGVHPFAAPEGAMSEGERYDRLVAEYGPVARRQLVFGLHVHVCVRGAGRALAVYDALRSYLPELAALAAHAPLYAGADTGLASVRPKLSELLPRQGVPPAFGSWDAVAAAHRWCRAAGDAAWWWEARLHPQWGTLEVRVPDAQATVAESAAVAAVVHALVADLAARHDAGERLAVHDSWRIAENRWSACRHGAAGVMRDLDTGAPVPTRERLAALLDRLAPAAAALGCAAELQAARALGAANGAQRLRERAATGGPHGATAWLAERFDASEPG